MHPFFAALSPHESTLLLTLLTAGGSDQVGCLGHLPEPRRSLLQEKAQALLAIDSERRVQLMVLELKALWADHGQRSLERVDPSWIVYHLRGEGPRVVGVVLLGLQRALQRQVLQRLPTAVRQQLPRKEEIRQLPAAVLDSVRQRFANRLHPMPLPGPAPIAFADCLHLPRRELYVLVRSLGLIELGQAFVSVGKVALAELCRRLPRPQAEELVYAVRQASQTDLPDLSHAQRFLSRIIGNFDDTEEFLQKSGLWRLAKAAGREPPSWQQALAQRLPRRAALQLLDFIARAQEMADITDLVRQRLQDVIIVRLVVMARRNIIGANWATAQLTFHDPQASQEALVAAEAAAEFEPTAAG